MSSGSRGWTSIKVRKDLDSVITEYAKQRGEAKHKVIAKAIHFYVLQEKKAKVKEDLPLIDKITWYIVKMSMSAGRLKENPSEENLNAFLRTVSQIEERFEIRLDWAKRAAQEYIKERSAEASIELNSAVKNAAILLMNEMIEEGE